MKKVALVLVLSLLLLVVPVFAGKDDISVAGNETPANYTAVYWDVTQLNATIETDEYVWYRARINVSCNTTLDPAEQAEVATLTDINYTLGDEWANATATTYIILQNVTEEESLIYQTANATYADGTYLKAYFNLTGQGIEVTNTSNSTWYVIYRIKKMDDMRTVSSTKTGNAYEENVTYYGPSDLDIENVTLDYSPTSFSKREVLRTVIWNGTTVTNYTAGKDNIKFAEPDFSADSSGWFYISYILPESGHGATGAGRRKPTVTPPVVGPPVEIPIVTWIINILMAIFGLR